MPRPLRIQYSNAWYHVMNRGLGGQKIFKNNAHRYLFLETLIECERMFNIEVHAYCLMGNHYHLLLRTPDSNLSRAMRHLNGVYTQKFNRMVKTDGPLFRGRYKSQLIEEDNYLLIVSRYIHLNPVEAKLVDNPADYAWSSYSAYIGKYKPPNWLKTSAVLDLLKQTKMLSHINDYMEYVEYSSISDINIFTGTKLADPILGSTKFKEEKIGLLDESVLRASAADVKKTKVKPCMALIASAVCQFYKINELSLYQSKKGKLNLPRLVFMYICRHQFGYAINDISKPMNCLYRSTVSTSISKIRRLLQGSPELNREIEIIYEQILNQL